ncbi:MAG: CDP-diacylglycerol--serine O-phosphatidyltransferase [Deltaproteobacteria bacterium RBG_13_52_11]|nr:MAG: CDP-diacylglycerol--serine O-phosphatidyltransferase [Deltaproteobacteria bacterium RBG_13_52_11]
MNKKKHKKTREGVRRGVHILPNLLTSGSLFGGFYAIVAAFSGDYLIAAAAIFIAIFLDGVDGKVARLTRTTSRFGVEYDSLSDLVAFGVAPAILVFTWALQPYGRLGWLAAFLYVACGALRLARFNVQADTVEPRSFRGLPIPMAAAVIAATVLLLHHLGETGDTKHLSFLILIYVLAFLMVSNIRYPSFKNLELLKRKPFNTLVAMTLTIVVVVAEPAIMLFIISFVYLLMGPVNVVRGWYWKRVAASSEKKTQPLTR